MKQHNTPYLLLQKKLMIGDCVYIATHSSHNVISTDHINIESLMIR